jgi:hypothetical protein
VAAWGSHDAGPDEPAGVKRTTLTPCSLNFKSPDARAVLVLAKSCRLVDWWNEKVVYGILSFFSAGP